MDTAALNDKAPLKTALKYNWNYMVARVPGDRYVCIPV